MEKDVQGPEIEVNTLYTHHSCMYVIASFPGQFFFNGEIYSVILETTRPGNEACSN